jgi:hypothetical protein
MAGKKYQFSKNFPENPIIKTTIRIGQLSLMRINCFVRPNSIPPRTPDRFSKSVCWNRFDIIWTV